MIILSNVYKSFDNLKTYSVQDINLSIVEGKTLVLLGSSGSGKSTLLQLINNTINPTSGRIHIDGIPLSAYPKVQLHRSMGFVFQHTGLFPHMTVAKNISIVMQLMGFSREQQNAKVFELLTKVKLKPEKYYKRYPDELSGGEQQRVGVARALATNPKYVLMDEPFAALDAITRENLQNEVMALCKQFKTTLIFVTHDIKEAFKIADRIAILHQGHLEQVGTKDEVSQNPATEFIQQLLQFKGD